MRRGNFCLGGLVLYLIDSQWLAAELGAAGRQKTSHISGWVEGPDGKPAAGASIWLPGVGASAQQQPSSVGTDADIESLIAALAK